MKLGTQFPHKWKEKSQNEGIALADILYGYAVEDIMQRIAKSSFREYLWIVDEGALGESSYRRKNKKRFRCFSCCWYRRFLSRCQSCNRNAYRFFL